MIIIRTIIIIIIDTYDIMNIKIIIFETFTNQ